MATLRGHSPNSLRIEDALESIGLGWYQHRLLMLSGICWAVEAMEVTLVSFIVIALEDQQSDWSLAGWEGTLTAVVFMGILLGGLAWGYLADIVGRKRSYFCGCFLAALFGSLSALAPSIEFLVVCRFLVGFGAGGVPVMYTLSSEFLPVRDRGPMLLINNVMWGVGTLVEVFIVWATLDAWGWRWFVFCSSVPLWMILALFFVVPESPRFLHVKGREAEAVDILCDMARVNGAPFTEEFTLVCAAPESHAATKLAQIFNPVMRAQTVALYFLWTVVAMAYYGIALATPYYFRGDAIYSFCALVVLAEFPGFGLAALLIGSWGRLRFLRVLFFLVPVLFAVLALSRGTGLNLVLLLALQMLTAGLFGTLYVYTSEVFPTTVRSLGVSIGSGFARFGAILACYLVSSEHHLTKAAWVFSGATALAFLAVVQGLEHETLGHKMHDNLLETYDSYHSDESYTQLEDSVSSI